MTDSSYSSPFWFAMAECAKRTHTGVNWHAEEDGEDPTPALRICWFDCKVRKKCQEYGKTQEYGIYGGILASVRRKMHRRENQDDDPEHQE